MNGRAENLEVGRRLRDQGVADTLAADVAPHRDFRPLVDEAIHYWIREGSEFTADHIHDYLAHHYPDAQPHCSNVISGAFRHAAADGLMQYVRHERSSRTARRAGVHAVWIGTEHTEVAA